MPFWPFFLASGAAGFIGALDGVGGGLVLVPILTLMGVDIREAIPLGAVCTVVISNGASPVFLRRHLPNIRAGAFLELFAIPGALIGAVLTNMTSRRYLFLFCGSLLFISWFALWRKWRQKPHTLALESATPGKESMLIGSYYDYDDGKTVVYEGRYPMLGGLCMFGMGLVAGFLGGGGGVFTVLIVDLVIGFPTKVALTMSNLIMGTVALASLGVYLEKGLVDAPLMIPVVLGVLAGAFLGAQTLLRLKGQVVRTIFLCVLALLSLRMLHHGITPIR